MNGLQHYEPDAKDILTLRNETNAPCLECRRALIEAHGENERAKQLLREWSEQRRGSMIELYR